jgi:protoporphyrinogen oxidase
MLLARGYDVHLFEASDRIGGLCRSEVIDGFVYDLAGGHILHSRDRAVLGDMLAVLGNAVECRRNTKIYYHGRYVKYPFENGLADLPPEHNLECLEGYVDAHVQRASGAPEPSTFREWISWRFGAGMAERFMIPYNEKIWCVDLRGVSSEWCRGRVPEAPLGDVLRASLGLASEGYTHQLVFYYPRRGGFESLVRAFARGLESRIRTATPVRELVLHGGRGQGFEVNGERFDRVINTLPLRELFRVVRPRPPGEIVDAVAALKHLSLITVFVAVDKADLAPYTWIYLPHAENGPMNRITYAHNYSSENAPPGSSSILAEITAVGGTGPGDLDRVEAEVLRSLERLGLVKSDWVRFTRSHFNEYAYPLHDLHMRENLSLVLGWLDSLRIPSVGRFARYAYVNTDQVYAMVNELLANHLPALR